MPIHKGKIVRLHGTWGSGLASLTIDDAARGRVVIWCENAPTVRALEGAFGGVIGRGHTFSNKAIAGREIYYGVDGLGLLEGFTPVESASPDLVDNYERRSEQCQS